MKLISFLFSFYIIIQMPSAASCQEKHPLLTGKDIAIVQTRYGKVRGYIHNGIFTFKGIPYGKATRFMPAKEPSTWEGVRSSMTYGPTCPATQSPVLDDEYEFPFHRDRGYYTSEDCLNLNLWTPNTDDIQKKPVMVWLHGGGFSYGSSVEFPSYDGENLSRRGDVVVVSLNHRLNALGFLDLSAYGEKYKYSGNVGAMDMITALTWVKENISRFGGDPDNVTIFGQSGGGAKVISLMHTPSAKGLFHKAIVQSGSYFTRFTDATIAKKISAFVLEELNLRPEQVDSLQTIRYEILDAAGRKALQKAQATLKPNEGPGYPLEWEPVLDHDFLPYQPDEAMGRELAGNIPLLMGSTKNEYMPFDPTSRDIAMDNARIKLQQKYGDQTSLYIDAVKKTYPETVKPSDYIDIDFVFRPLVLDQAHLRSQHKSAPVYVYIFAWQSPVLDGIFKAYHCMDLPFVFNNIQRCEEMTGGGREAYLLADKVSGAWVHFAKTGNPGHGGLPSWPAYTMGSEATMIFDNTCVVRNHHDKELMMFGKGK